MLWIYLIVLQIFLFFGLIYFLRSILSRKISKATIDLEELSRDYVAKKEEERMLPGPGRTRVKNYIQSRQIRNAYLANGMIIFAILRAYQIILHNGVYLLKGGFYQLILIIIPGHKGRLRDVFPVWTRRVTAKQMSLLSRPAWAGGPPAPPLG